MARLHISSHTSVVWCRWVVFTQCCRAFGRRGQPAWQLQTTQQQQQISVDVMCCNVDSSELALQIKMLSLTSASFLSPALSRWYFWHALEPWVWFWACWFWPCTWSACAAAARTWTKTAKGPRPAASPGSPSSQVSSCGESERLNGAACFLWCHRTRRLFSRSIDKKMWSKYDVRARPQILRL